jgi:HEAT repeat protein
VVGQIGPDAESAIPALLDMLADPSEGLRNTACIGLGGIGPAAVAALPALRKALSDPSKNVRRFAQNAIDRITK